MDHFDDTEIGKLLRLKRFEQPPPGYFENFLHEFHRRQRDDLLRQPLWRICFDRMRDFMLRLNVPTLTSYPAAAAAVVVCAAVISLKIYETPTAPIRYAQTRTAATPIAITTPVDSEWSLSSPVVARTFSAKPLPIANARTHRAPSTPPRYVLDSVPVSYESTLRF